MDQKAAVIDLIDKILFSLLKCEKVPFEVLYR